MDEQKDLFERKNWPRKELFPQIAMKRREKTIEERALSNIPAEVLEELKEAKKKVWEAPTGKNVLNLLEAAYRKKYFEGIFEGIGKVSASKLTTAQGCRLGYCINYEIDIEPYVLAHLAFGSVIHSVIENFNNGRYNSLEEMLYGRPIEKGRKKEVLGFSGKWSKIMFSKRVLFFEESDKWMYKNLGPKILKKFYDRYKDRIKPLHVEKRFDFCYDCYNIRGRLDRVDEFSDRVEIVDFKTGWSSPCNVYLKFHPQLTIYALAYKEMQKVSPKEFPDKPLYLQLYYLNNDEVFTTRRSLFHVNMLIRDIEETDEKIKKMKSASTFDEFLRPFFGFHCGKCNVETSCDYIITDRMEEFHKREKVDYF